MTTDLNVMNEKTVLTAYSHLFQSFRQISLDRVRTGTWIEKDWLERLATGRWPVSATTFTQNELTFMGKTLCIHFNIDVQQNRKGKYYFIKVLSRFHVDKMHKHVFNSKPYSEINY